MVAVLSKFSDTLQWRAIERRRAVPYVAAHRLVATLFRKEKRAVVRVIKDGALDSINTVLYEFQKEWMRFYERFYLSVGKEFAGLVHRKLIGGRALNDYQTRVESKLRDDWEMIVHSYLLNTSGKKITRISDTNRTRIQSALAEGLENGEGMFDLARRIDRLYEGWTAARSMVIARTEVIQATNLGGRAGALSTGLRLNHKWLNVGDDRMRDSHAEYGGTELPIEEAYVINGSRMMFPGDISLGADPSETIQCRCSETYTERKG